MSKEKKNKRKSLITPPDIAFLMFVSFGTITAFVTEGFSMDRLMSVIMIFVSVGLIINNNKKDNEIMDLKEKLGIKDDK